MARKDDLENYILQSYDLVKEYESILLDVEDPKEESKVRRLIDKQWDLIKEFLGEYYRLGSEPGLEIPTEIEEMRRARFPDIKPELAEEEAPVHFSDTEPVLPSPGLKPIQRSRISLTSIPIGVVMLLVVLTTLLGFGLAGSLPFLLPTSTPDLTLTPVMTDTVPVPSLISLRYMAEKWDPRMVDLRTASSSGIPVRAGQALQLLDLWAWMPKDAPEYKVQAEIYAKDQFIGSTASQPLLAGTIQLGDVTVRDFHHGDYADAWRVQESWTDLAVVLVTSRGDEVMGSTRTMIHLDPSGTAWLFDPPNLNFVSIVYTVNDGLPLVLDLRDAGEAGIGVEPGDKLTLLEVWYDSNVSGGSNYTVQFEAYLSSGGYNPDTLQVSESNDIQEGTHKLADFTAISWIIPDGKQLLVASLCRNDETTMDRLVFPLGLPSSLGLVRNSASMLDYDHSQFLDFESDSDLADWSGEVSRSSVSSFTGSYSLQASFTVTESTPFLRFATWDRDFTADAILAHYYLPETPNVEVELIQFCIPIGDWVCWSVDRTQGTWHTIMLDLSKMRHTGTDETLNRVSLPGLLVHGVIRSSTATEPIPYSIYLDALHILEDES